MRVSAYIKIARPDDWIKNVFVLPGVILAWFFDPGLFGWWDLGRVGLGLVAICLIASSYYVLNEILDAEKDRHHPVKRFRPIPMGEVRLPVAWMEYGVLGLVGLALSFWIDVRFGAAALMLWVMGALYNVPPIRLKDVPYADVLSESVNNPLRMALGWYSTGCNLLPPLTVLLAYWMFGAFLMAIKRLAEYRQIGNAEVAANYRKSFQHYNEERLTESIFFYAALFGMLAGVFMARYRLELVLATPFVALAMAYYLHLGYKPDSGAQYPEHLYREKKLMMLVALAFGSCVALLFVNLPWLYDLVSPTHFRR